MNKKPESVAEQERLLEIEANLAPKTRAVDILNIVVTLLVIFVLGSAVYIIPDAEFSEQENRYLQQFPKIQSNYSGNLIERIGAGKFLDRLIDGDFTAEMADYYADQFPLRDLFVGLKGISETAVGKSENNNAVIGSDGYIIARNDYPDMAIVKKNTDAAVKFADALAGADIPFTFALAGRTVDVMKDKLPALFPHDRTRRVWDKVESDIADVTSIRYISLNDTLTELQKSGDAPQLYYRTDHHWTSWGAYYAYLELAREMGFDALSADKLTAETVSEEFYGTTWSSAGLKWINPDTMHFLRYDGDTGYTTFIEDTGVSFDGFYDREFLSKKDKYSTFISGNNAVVRVTKNDAQNREKLLLIKDSFAHSVVPFLAYNYDLIIIDPRYYKLSAYELAKTEKVSGVLLLCNMASLTDTNVMGVLGFGIE